MSSSCLNLYKRAKELYDNNAVNLDGVKTGKDYIKFFFTVDDHNVELKITKYQNTKQWVREWKSDTTSYSLFQDKIEDSYIKAAELYLMHGK